jgi:hypothetical protein
MPRWAEQSTIEWQTHVDENGVEHNVPVAVRDAR